MALTDMFLIFVFYLPSALITYAIG